MREQVELGRFNVELFRGVLRLGRQGCAGPLLHQPWQDLFWASLLDEQASSRVFDGRLQIRDALEDKPRPKRTGLHMSPAVLGPKAVVQHNHRDHLVAAKRLSQGRIVVESQVVSEPVEGAGCAHVRGFRGWQEPHRRGPRGLVVGRAAFCPRSGRPCRCAGCARASPGFGRGNANRGC